LIIKYNISSILQILSLLTVFSFIKKYLYLKYINMNLLNGNPVCLLSGNEFLPKKGVTFAEQVANFFTSQGGVANSPFGMVILDKKGVQNSKQHGIGRIKAASFAAIKDVLEKGEIVLPLDEYEVHGKKQITGMIAAPIQIGEERYVCVVMIIANLEQKRLYVHESFLTKNLQEVVASNSVRGSNASSPQPQGDIANILQNYLINKPTIENNNIKENKKMNMSKIRLSEAQLHRVIKESVKKVLKELSYQTMRNAYNKANNTNGHLSTAAGIYSRYQDMYRGHDKDGNFQDTNLGNDFNHEPWEDNIEGKEGRQFSNGAQLGNPSQNTIQAGQRFSQWKNGNVDSRQMRTDI
jgi:hypothetical protein